MTVTINTLLNLTQMHGYFFILMMMIVEGPLVTCIAAFAASLGYFNIWIIFILSLLGSIIPDIALYFVGFYSRGRTTERVLEYFGINKKIIKRLEKGLKEHTIKTIFISRLAPMLPIPGILLSGFARVSFKKYLAITLVLAIVFSTIFALLGFYFGLAFDTIAKYFKLGQNSIFLGLIFLLLLYGGYKFIYLELRKKFKIASWKN